MKLSYPRIGLTVKPDLSQKQEIVERIVAIMRNEGAEVLIDRKHLDDVPSMRLFPAIERPSDIDALLVIGGDGTILRAVRELNHFSTPILSVNRGAVGFLAEIAMDEADRLLPSLLKGEGAVEERHAVWVEVVREGRVVFENFALNEAVISQGAIARLLDVRACIGDEYLTTYHADGLIVATPTGSTAYSLAAGGPVVHPRINGLILTPINPHSFTQRPIVIPGISVVEAEVIKKPDQFHNATVSLTLDGQVYEELEAGDKVRVRMHLDTVKFVRRKEDTFFRTLRTKLKWGERLEA